MFRYIHRLVAFLPRIRRPRLLLFILFVILSSTTILALWITTYTIEHQYDSLLSVTIYDRHQVPLSIQENAKGHYVSTLDRLPSDFTELLVQKEDRFFYYHPGINPLSTLRALYRRITLRNSGGASTITQQLAKNILGTELDRTLPNKLRELFYALSLELFYTKDTILLMYANTVYLGNQVQGFETGSYAYFNKRLSDTSYSERLSLLATLSYPNSRNPWQESNERYAKVLHERYTPNEPFTAPLTTAGYSFQSDTFFELRTAHVACSVTCVTAVDNEVTTALRDILKRHLTAEAERGARNGAIVVIDPHTSELVAMVGSKNPKSTAHGDQINMALAPRPIGSTVKPFIYLKGFEDGLRPYTLVDDREYKYSIATGFPLYPKNFDGQYRGEVTLHESLSNSLNVPSIKVLEYVSLHNFYAFLSNQLLFKPLRPYDSYQYGIALGGLEMDLLTLTHYFTVFPRHGTLAPLKTFRSGGETAVTPPQSEITSPRQVTEAKYTELVHAILSDRFSGVNQFGLESTLSIETEGYGVKTGTSRDFHDSWAVGYTGDFVVGVWVGNVENEPLKQITGQSGAGAVWHDTMNYLLESDYHRHTKIPQDSITLFPILHSNEWGLRDDKVDEHRTLLKSQNLIISPHPEDSFELFAGMTIPLRSTAEVEWFVNGTTYGVGRTIEFHPTKSDTYEIVAVASDTGRREIIDISIITPQ